MLLLGQLPLSPWPSPCSLTLPLASAAAAAGDRRGHGQPRRPGSGRQAPCCVPVPTTGRVTPRNTIALIRRRWIGRGKGKGKISTKCEVPTATCDFSTLLIICTVHASYNALMSFAKRMASQQRQRLSVRCAIVEGIERTSGLSSSTGGGYESSYDLYRCLLSILVDAIESPMLS